MKIIQLINRSNPSLSFEVFPPKSGASYESVMAAVGAIAGLSPSFISVTYGAGGGTSEYTLSIAADIQKQHRIPALAHLSCVKATKEGVRHQLDQLKQEGIENILALRGDMDAASGAQNTGEYRYASELIRDIRDYGGFCIGAACYPEVHTESQTQYEDIKSLKEKQDAGCAFLTTQMFFDNHVYYNFLYKLREAGIGIPVVAGIMPVINAAQIKRIAALSGTVLPQRFRYIVDRFGCDAGAMKQAGIAYATEQIVDLFANGVSAVHVYSLNHASVAQKIADNLSEVIRCRREGHYEN